MISLLSITLIPLLIATIGLFPRNAGWIARGAACLILLQIPVVLSVCIPVLTAPSIINRSFGIDGVAAGFILITTLVAVAALVHSALYLPADRTDAQHISDRQFCLYYTLSGMFLLAMYGVLMAQNIGYMWVAMEFTTLMSAPLVFYHRSSRSIEAAWKYLLLCSVGIGFALLGTVLFVAAQHDPLFSVSMQYSDLLSRAPHMNPRLVSLGFIFCLLGYGTKAGLFPLHNWLPDAHSEAPAPASAMLSGALLNCALVAIWRISQIVSASGQAHLVRELLVPAGAITALAAGLMLVRQHDLKRMWAYSSVEHVGLLTLAIGIGSGPLFLLHAFNHSVVKVTLFLLAGSVIYSYNTKSLKKISGMLKASPATGAMLILAAFAIAGSPPFGTFISEWLLLRDTFASGEVLAGCAALLSLTITFVAIASHVSRLVLGPAPANIRALPSVAWSVTPAILLCISLLAGAMVNPTIMAMLTRLTLRGGTQ